MSQNIKVPPVNSLNDPSKSIYQLFEAMTKLKPFEDAPAKEYRTYVVEKHGTNMLRWHEWKIIPGLLYGVSCSKCAEFTTVCESPLQIDYCENSIAIGTDGKLTILVAGQEGFSKIIFEQTKNIQAVCFIDSNLVAVCNDDLKVTIFDIKEEKEIGTCDLAAEIYEARKRRNCLMRPRLEILAVRALGSSRILLYVTMQYDDNLSKNSLFTWDFKNDSVEEILYNIADSQSQPELCVLDEERFLLVINLRIYLYKLNKESNTWSYNYKECHSLMGFPRFLVKNQAGEVFFYCDNKIWQINDLNMVQYVCDVEPYPFDKSIIGMHIVDGLLLVRQRNGDIRVYKEQLVKKMVALN